MQSKPMDEHHLLAILRTEESDASAYYSSELAHTQAEHIERYMGMPYGDEVEGRSRVVSHDVEDTINWIMPHIMRLFLDSDDLLTVEDETRDIAAIEQQVSHYLNHIFFRDNDGESILHDFVWDGLVQRIGVVRVSYQDPEPQPAKEYRKLAIPQAQQILENVEYEVLEASEPEVDERTGVPTVDLKVQRTPKCGRVVVETVAPEEFAISTRAKSIDQAGYHRLKQEVYLADLVRQFPDHASDLDANGTHSVDDQSEDLDSDPRRQARFASEHYDVDGSDSDEQERRTVDLLIEWIRIDYDGDGVVELRQVKRVGNTILENIEVDHSELVEWSPIRIPHRAIGRSIPDQIVDIQKINTVVTRTYLDSLAQSLMPRTVVSRQAISHDASVLDQIIDRDIGDTIVLDGDARAALAEFATPDVSQSALAALEHFDQQLEQASGVMRHAQGHRAEAVTDTADGIKRLQSAANGRIELIGRWAAKGVEKIFQRILNLVVQYQDQPRIIHVSGKPMPIDPTTWSDEMVVSVHVGIAAETRDEKLQKLMAIAQKQEQLLIQFGNAGISPLMNPIVSLEQYSNTLREMIEVAGMKDADRYFSINPMAMQAMAMQQGQQQADPKALEAQAKLQLEQAKMQAETQMAQQKQAFEQQRLARELQFKEALAEREANTQEQMQSMKLATEREIAALRVQSEQQIARERMEYENRLAYDRMDMERQIARERQDDQREMMRTNAVIKANGISTNRPGGDLSK